MSDEDLFRKILKYGLKKGADQIEVFILEGSSDIVQLEKNAIFASESKSITGFGVRAYTKKGLGIATSSIIDKESLKEITEKAVKLSKLSPPDNLFATLPGPFTKYPEISGLCDCSINDLPEEEITEMAINSIENASKNPLYHHSCHFARSVLFESPER